MRDTRDVARDLLGCYVLHLYSGFGPSIWLCGEIVETEAYLTGDPASHAFRGPTPRNRVMFGLPGRAYIYISYGIHTMLNLVCQPEGVAEAVLIRALEPVQGLETMLDNRGNPKNTRAVTNGPGRLAQALGLTLQRCNGADITNPNSDLQIIGRENAPVSIVTTTRIGLTVGKELPYRYYISGNPYVSRK